MQIYPIFSLNQADYFRIVDSTSKLYDAIFIFPPGIETEINGTSHRIYENGFTIFSQADDWRKFEDYILE